MERMSNRAEAHYSIGRVTQYDYDAKASTELHEQETVRYDPFESNWKNHHYCSRSESDLVLDKHG